MPRLKKYSQIYTQNSVSNFDYQKGQYITKKNQVKHQESISKQSDEKNSSENSEQQSESRQSQYSQSINQTKQVLQASQNKQKETRKSTYKKNNDKKHNADEILKKLQQQYAKTQQYQLSKHQDDETNIQIPEDVLVGFQQKKNKNKKDKNAIKIKNKFFDIEICVDKNKNQPQIGKKDEVEQDIQQLRRLEQQHKQILAMRNSKNIMLMNERKNQIQQKVSRMRQRLQFKNAHEDVRFKQHIKQTLNNVKDCEQVQIMIEAPKIFKGASARQTDAALFIKNMSQNPQYKNENFTQDSINKQNDEIRNKKIHRKQFYQQFTRQVKQIKAVNLPTQTNQIFKKSSLDELQIQFEKNQHLFKQDTNTRKSLTHLQEKSTSYSKNIRKSLDHQKQNSSRQNSQSKLMRNSSFKSINKIQVVQEDQLNQQSVAVNKAIIHNINISVTQKAKQVTKSQNQQQIPKQNHQQKDKIKNKSKKKQDKKVQTRTKETNQKKQTKQKNKKSRKNNEDEFHQKIIGLFQLQAEDSQNGYGDDGQSSESGDNDSLQSLIDRKSVKIIKKNQRNARRKFIDEEMKKDQQIIRKIKQQITAPRKIKCQQNSQSIRRRRKRIDQAREKFQEEDKAYYQKNEQNVHEKNNCKQNQQDSSKEFFKKLQDLQDQICIKQTKNQISRIQKVPIGLDKSKKTVWRQIITANKPDKELQKSVIRGGLLINSKAVTGSKIQVPKKIKSKPKNIKF